MPLRRNKREGNSFQCAVLVLHYTITEKKHKWERGRAYYG